MIRSLPLRSLLVALSLVVVASGTIGCAAKKKPVVSTGSATGRGTFSGTGTGTGAPGEFDPTAGGTLTDEEALARLRAQEAARNAAGGNNPQIYGGEKSAVGTPIPDLGIVYFGFDSDVLDTAATMTLDKNTSYLSSHPELRVVLRGHADQEGTEEYNLSLGERRALAVRDHLIGAGIDGSKLETVSFGKMIPASEGTDVASQAQNRRVEFFVYTVE